MNVRHDGSFAAVEVSVGASSPPTVERMDVAGDGEFVVVHELSPRRLGFGGSVTVKTTGRVRGLDMRPRLVFDVEAAPCDG